MLRKIWKLNDNLVLWFVKFGKSCLFELIIIRFLVLVILNDRNWLKYIFSFNKYFWK